MTSIDETIYNLLNQSPQCSSSKHDYRSNTSENRNKNSHRTMGPAIVSKPDPSHPLRRREKYLELPQITPFIRSHRMPPIPKVTDRNRTQLNPSKDFIQENIKKIIHSLPICPRRFVVSDRKGNKFLIDGSGLQKEFIYKKNYGQIPLYLQARQTSDERLNCQSKDNSTVLLSAEERLCLINNLKDRYKNVFAQYQRLPLRLETISNITREAYLTNELIHIEQDMNFLEKHQEILVEKNSSDILR